MITPGAFDPGRDAWLRRALSAAPRMPAALLDFLSAALADPKATSDSLLWMADALEEAAASAKAAGRAVMTAELKALADLPRQLAPLRAWQAQTPYGVDLAAGDDVAVEGVIESDGSVTMLLPGNKGLAALRGLPLRLRRRSWTRKAQP
nr:hypothetical protein [uncultured Rhodopila sp.]